MPQTTVSVSNLSKPAPKWFRKLKRAVSILSDTAVVMLLSMGQAENSLTILWCRVGISGLMNALEIILANGEEYVSIEEKTTQP